MPINKRIEGPHLPITPLQTRIAPCLTQAGRPRTGGIKISQGLIGVAGTSQQKAARSAAGVRHRQRLARGKAVGPSLHPDGINQPAGSHINPGHRNTLHFPHTPILPPGFGLLAERLTNVSIRRVHASQHKPFRKPFASTLTPERSQRPPPGRQRKNFPNSPKKILCARSRPVRNSRHSA